MLLSLKSAADFTASRRIRARIGAGFSLIELMVGLVVSLICTLAIMSAFAIFEGQKRTTTNANDAQQNGSYALYTIERQVRSGGSGLVQGHNPIYGLWGCPISASTGGTVVLPATPPAPFAAWPATTRAMPVLIASGGTDASGNVLPDIIGTVSGNPSARVFSAAVSSTPTTGVAVLSNAFGILSNDYLIGTLTSGNCALAQTAAAPDGTGAVLFNPGNTATTGMQTATQVFDLGPNPIVSLFGVDLSSTSGNYNSLLSYDLLRRPVNGQAAAALPIADGIVMIKALYGIHTGANAACQDLNCIDQWVAPTGTWAIATVNASATSAASAMLVIKAIRVVVVAQSRLSQRNSDYSVGKPSLTLFTDLPLSQQMIMTTDPTVRYKIYDTTIPIRNSLILKYL